MKLFSYVVDHDHGGSPNPYHGFCTLVHCKFKKSNSRRPNIIELAKEGDWIVGTGGADLTKSAGHGKLIYAMKVTEKLELLKYYKDRRFKNKKQILNGSYVQYMGDILVGNRPLDIKNRYALISRHFYYFGKEAVTIPRKFRKHPLEKKGPGYRAKFQPNFIKSFINWLETNNTVGRHGTPCAYNVDARKKCGRCLR